MWLLRKIEFITVVTEATDSGIESGKSQKKPKSVKETHELADHYS